MQDVVDCEVNHWVIMFDTHNMGPALHGLMTYMAYCKTLPSPLAENDLEKGTWNLKHLTRQVVFYAVFFRSILTKFPNFIKVGLENTTA